VFLIILLLIVFLFYKSSLLYYFISDDFLGFIKINNLFDLIKIDPFNNHYSPVIKVIGFILNKFFAFNPFPYHFYTIFIHLVNIYLVYSLSKLFFNSKVKNILSALIFAFFFANYEVVFWYGASNNSLLVTFYILSLIFLIKYVSHSVIPSGVEGSSKYSILFQIFFILAFLTHEYAISLIPVGIIYWWFFTEKKGWKESLKLFSVPVFAVILTTVLKVIFVKIPLIVRTPSILKFIAFTMRSFVYLFIPNPYIVDKIPNIFIPIIFLILLIFLFKVTKNKRALFLLIWAAATIFIYSLTSAPQARYFYLSFIPVIIFITSVISNSKVIPTEMEGSSKKDFSTPPPVGGSARNDNIGRQIIFISYLSFILISGVVFLQNQKYYWRLNSQITKNVINDLKKYFPKLQKTDVLYFVNLPDSSNNSIWKAYVFRAGFEGLLNNFANIYPKKIIYLTSFKPTPHTMDAPYITPEKLSELKQKNIIFIYNEELKTVILMPSHPQGD